jgi:predicted Zn-dependent protease
MASMFQKLLDRSKSQPGALERFFSTHPVTQDRIRDAESRASKITPRGTITDEPEFQAIRRRV